MIPRRSASFIFGRLALGVTSLTLAASVMFDARSTPADPAQVADASTSDGTALPGASAGSSSFAEQNDETLASLKLSATPQNPLEGAAGAATSSCPSGMVDVEGDYCPWVEQKCLRWLDPETKMRCAEFAPTSECLTKTVKKHVCMDKYEYPNRVGANPVVMKTWYEARATCSGEGKRLCTESEWTLACEGEERLPYPYGYARSSEACNID
jgi:hypothetical protein